MNIDRSSISKLVLAKHLYCLSEKCCWGENEYTSSTALILLQDSLEAAFLATLSSSDLEDSKNKKKSNTFNTFDGLMKLAESKVGTFKNNNQLSALNKARVGIKHYGIIQSLNEIRNFLYVTKETLEHISHKAFNIPFLEASLLVLVIECTAKSHLSLAEKLIREKKYYEALLEIRKALFLEFEQDYDVSYLLEYIDKPDQEFDFFRLSSIGIGAYQSTSKEYLQKEIYTPFDLIMINWEIMRQNLLKSGISIQDFENIYHLTPRVIKLKTNNTWNIYDEDKYRESANREDAIYCLDRMIEILLQKQNFSERRKTAPWVALKKITATKDVDVYDKTDEKKEVTYILKRGNSYTIQAKFTGVDGETYYEIMHDSQVLNQFILERDLE